MPGSIADAHCHLADLNDPAGAIADAAAAGVAPILAVSMGPDDGAAVLQLACLHPDRVLAGIGLHPSRVPGLDAPGLERELEVVARRLPRAAFLGEVGLDYKDAPDPPQQRRQVAVLERLLDLAAAAGRPVNLHTRRADRDLLSMAGSFHARTGLPAVLHWFTHSKKLARRCGETGLFISVGPSILHDPRQAEVARVIEGDLLLVETDSPVSYGGVEARPALAAQVADALASLRGTAPGVMRERLAANLERYLRPAV